jgi:2-octaprenyl-6-methoxyphenol hydroxylase
VIGAGPVGTSLAILTAAAGFRTVLVDARDPDRDPPRDTRNFAIVRGSWRLLGAAGVHPALHGLTQPLLGLEATDGGRHWFGAPSVLFGTDDLPPDADGEPLGEMVPAEALQAALDSIAAKAANLTWLRGRKFTALATDAASARITLDTGDEITAGLVAACDGVRSPVRTALGIPTEGRAYGKSVFAADVRLERPHNGLARQLFTPDGPFATLPLPGNRANLAWYMKTGAAETMAALPADAIEAELNARFSDFAGPMTLDGPPLSYPLHLQIAAVMTGPRTALLGDAARRINPLAGQGLNLGFKDVGALVDVMTDARRVGLDPGAATSLQRYQQWRRFDAATTAMFMDAVERAFSNDNAILKPLRGLALTAASKLGPVRRAMARQASADQPGLPSLMR